MIKATDIRIGNYVNVPREDQSPFRIDLMEYVTADFCKVGMNVHKFEFAGKLIDGHPLTWEIQDLKGIPLTEEWLLKFGFELNDDFVSEDHLWKDWVRKGVRIQLPYFEWADSDRELSIEIKFVHQLQNLHYALTGEELTEKPL